MKRLATTIRPAAPFSLELTAGYHSYFQNRYGTDHWQDGCYRRLLNLNGRLALVSATSSGTLDEPELTVEVRGDDLTEDDGQEATRQVEWLLGTRQELEPFYQQAGADPRLSILCDQLRGLHVPHTGTVFEALVLAVLGQQISTSVARVMRTLLIENYGQSQNVEGVDYYTFPQPNSLADASVDDLRSLKLSYRKAEYIQGIARAACDGLPRLAFSDEMSDAEVVEEITRLRGVGKWTAQWTLLRALGRQDALPLGDLALRRVVSNLYFGGAPVTDDEVEAFAARWSPWRTYATVYLFAAMRTGMA